MSTTSNDLTTALLNCIEDLAAKKITAQDAIAIAKTAQTIINLKRLEMDYAQMINRDANIKFLEQHEG